ncbi:ABL059Wp [Eremothecium gossypii ATCC 10895]|uniref:ABL059Wp n=1 Tax=Eremothecium gossypii (strain ATCC 10895 / CBS 109.51 / FGSC 9923 / NRRL Y-1056) TaxID=284811 RepID=Q75E82_EREGS|nr:ABL059Wp [Eremothecium gossypii ATCC 10895]AAS50712.1 ABL059Wp [Eremothecium gossypii ATCC 10895]AEY95001.1 FABL059Wp [Eremothecium gossypii FDAG1]
MDQNTECTVYVGNLDPQVSKELLYELFVQVAPVSRIRYPKDKVKQEHQGFAFVELFSEADCDFAIKSLNNTVSLFGKVLKVRRTLENAKNSAPVFARAKLFVKNLDSTIDAVQLQKLFGKFGPLAKPPQLFTLKDGALRCAYVYFTTFRHSDEALEKLNNQIVANQIISIDYAFKEGKAGEKHGDPVERLLDEEAQKHGVVKLT